MAGFRGSLFHARHPGLQVPTTVVAQWIQRGRQNGVNHPLGKNTIGMFHQPLAVVMDMELLSSLPDRELKPVAENHQGVIADAALFAYMEEHGNPVTGQP